MDRSEYVSRKFRKTEFLSIAKEKKEETSLNELKYYYTTKYFYQNFTI